MTNAETPQPLQDIFAPPGTAVPGLLRPPRVNFLRTGFATGIVVGTLSLPTSVAVSAEPFRPQAVVSATHTLSAPLPPVPAEVDNLSVGSVLLRIRSVSSLNWSQVALALGVSRRTVHNWLSGTQIAPVHLERVGELAKLVDAAAVGQPTATRSLLTSPGPHGRTVLEEFALENQPVGRNSAAGVRVADLLAPDSSPVRRVIASEPRRTSALRPVVVRPRQPS